MDRDSHLAPASFGCFVGSAGTNAKAWVEVGDLALYNVVCISSLLVMALARETLEFDRRVLRERFELTDFARKVVGVGSVGTRAWIALLLGRDGLDPPFLQMKEAEASVASSDIFLGWLHVESGLDGKPRDFYGRQLKDWKGSAEIEQMVPKGLAAYGKLCGWTLALAHARSRDRVAIAAYLGNSDSLDRAILELSKAYAEQNDRDYQALAAAVKSGTITAQTGL